MSVIDLQAYRDQSVDSDAIRELIDKEWLVTNGLGGYASGTVLGDLTRRYHGLFVPNLSNPKGRHLVISRCIEEFIAPERVARQGEPVGRVGESAVRLGEPCARQRDFARRQLPWLVHFRFEHNIATWEYALDAARIEKSILMPHTQNTVCVRYTLTRGESIVLKLRPYLAFRRQDAPLHRKGFGEFALTALSDRSNPDRYEVSLAGCPILLRMAVQPQATLTVEPHDLAQELHRERRRGHEFDEWAHSMGYFEATLTPGASLTFIASTHTAERLHFDVPAAFAAECERIAPTKDLFATKLKRAADQFLVLPAARIEDAILANARGHELRSVIAGYHWFGDWGRDTMISLEGLMLCTGREREARSTLQTFASYVTDGLLPNLFPEGERQGIYNTVDATLWYFHALHRYLGITNDGSLLGELMPVLESIFEHHFAGTKFGIRMDADGLIAAAAEGYQLTWMDAKVDGWVVTPRRGKPVEIQALWYNALRLMQGWTKGDAAQRYKEAANRARATFNRRFWNADRKCLLDVIDGPTGDDASLRPNQIFSISLDHPILDRDRWRAVIATVRSELLTPFGLRTLSRDHRDYKATYHGDLRARDAAYHQGTVWPWLIGHFIDAYLKSGGAKSDARAMLRAFEAHLASAGIGSISEIFDAEPPHTPHGCIAQAWSVAEVLRTWVKCE